MLYSDFFLYVDQNSANQPLLIVVTSPLGFKALRFSVLNCLKAPVTAAILALVNASALSIYTNLIIVSNANLDILFSMAFIISLSPSVNRETSFFVSSFFSPSHFGGSTGANKIFPTH